MQQLLRRISLSGTLHCVGRLLGVVQIMGVVESSQIPVRLSDPQRYRFFAWLNIGLTGNAEQP